jgi:glucosamine--fructose-6-phosphate aminotransferase (isomerizing)
MIEKQWLANRENIQALCQRLKNNLPAFAMTVARGSSDHAATFAKYLLEIRLQ